MYSSKSRNTSVGFNTRGQHDVNLLHLRLTTSISSVLVEVGEESVHRARGVPGTVHQPRCSGASSQTRFKFTMPLYCTSALYTCSHTVSTNQSRLRSPTDSRLRSVVVPTATAGGRSALPAPASPPPEASRCAARRRSTAAGAANRSIVAQAQKQGVRVESNVIIFGNQTLKPGGCFQSRVGLHRLTVPRASRGPPPPQP